MARQRPVKRIELVERRKANLTIAAADIHGLVGDDGELATRGLLPVVV